MNQPSSIRMPFIVAVAMVLRYVGKRIWEQVRSISFILLYLLAFQWLVLRSTPEQALSTAAGIGAVVLGLTLFLEGLFLGLMPIGERVGVGLPRRCGLFGIALFGLLLGMGSTFAEPAIAALRVAGSSVNPWESPLLYYLLNQRSQTLVSAIALGVGVAVVCGLVRFRYGLAIKPFLFVLFPAALAMSVFCVFDPNLSSLLGLAWDSGAVTTGAVTVPLVLAVGIGVSRASGKQTDAAGGFGVIVLASILPVISVLVLGWLLRHDVPAPMDKALFFSEGNAAVRETLGLGLEGAYVPGATAATGAAPTWGLVFREEALAALQAVVPLTGLLLIVLLLLRDRMRYRDEVVLGIGLALAGMTLLTAGIRTGLAPLGEQVGRPLPRVFRSDSTEAGRVQLRDFDRSDLFTVYSPEGEPEKMFYVQGPKGNMEAVRFDPGRYRPDTGTYEHVLETPPLFGPEMTAAGIALVFLFAFGLGYGATLAEPALSALARTVEDVSVGTIRGNQMVRVVALGVGAGLLLGVVRLLYDLPLLGLLLPSYVVVLVLTLFSEDGFAAIAWDCGGVTTGGITVPLVLAMGLGLGAELDVRDGFGVLALACLYPVGSVLMYGLWIRARQSRQLHRAEKEDGDG